MKKTIPTKIDLPFEEGKTYLTKFQTGDKFLLKKINWKEFKENGVMVKKMILFNGVYENLLHLGLCSLTIDRLYPENKDGDEIEICGKCGEKL